MTEEEAEEHLDELTMIYTGNPHFFGDIMDPEGRKNYTQSRLQHYYGDIVPLDQQEKETRVIFKIAPMRVTTDAIFN